MKLYKISIVPLELFTISRILNLEKKLIKNKIIFQSKDRLALLFSEMGGGKARMYNVSTEIAENLKLAFFESSLCIYYERINTKWEINYQTIIEELKERNINHTDIVNNSKKSVIFKILNKIVDFINKDEYDIPKVNYVFSFFIIENTTLDTIPEEKLKILAEPSSIDLDDMISTDTKLINNEMDKLKIENSNNIKDIDLSNYAKTYITWATIVSISTKDSIHKTRNLLSALECRLQITWNRCYSVSLLIDNIFDNTVKIKEIDELYWSFTKTLDDAKSVLTSTYSSRADKLFSEMIKTSKLKGEIGRLEQKINLLEKYINQQNTKRNKKYQKTIELLLFITAIASLAQVFFPLPMNFLPENIEYILVFFITIIGAIAIYKSK